MSDLKELLDFTKGAARSARHANGEGKDKPNESDASAEDYCPAYGYLRGIRERALSLEVRFRDGNSDWFPYSWLGPVRFNPSVGLLLKFTGDTMILVLIRGSNLDTLVNQSINLTDRGIGRHRILWLREMDEEEMRQAGNAKPTIDRIEVAEFDAQEDLQEWLKKNAPVFLRQ